MTLIASAILTVLIGISGYSQSVSGVADTAPMVLEIEYSKGMQLTYQRIGGSTMFGAYRMLPDWKPTPETPMIQGINMKSSTVEGGVMIRISVLEGKYLETEVPVGEYKVTEGKRTIVSDLSKFGVVPIEVSLVKAPVTVAILPSVINKSKSLNVTVEPVTANMPSYRVRVSNLSPKGLMAYAFETSSEGRKHLSGISRNLNDTVFIEPGQSAEKIMPYPVQPQTTSTGKMPEARQTDVVFSVLAAIFEDGTYEGDPVRAADIRSIQIGQKIEILRILNQLRGKYDSADAFAADLSDIKFTMDEDAFAAFLNQFPTLKEQDIKRLRETVEFWAVSTRRDISKVFSKQREEFGINLGSFQVWKEAEIKQCERLLNSFPK